jgi:fucose 4-O-acetylase-like acetyltransferase
MTKRITYIDQLKGLAIFFVAIGHFIQYNTFESKSGTLFSVIYSFHMPLFMFISGYVAFKTIRIIIFENYFGFILKRIKSLLIPFFAWPLLVDNFFFNNNLNVDLYSQLAVLLKDPRGGLWFLWYLFFLTVIYTFFLLVANSFNKKTSIFKDLVIAALLLCFLVVLRVINIAVYTDSFIQYFGYFFIGIFISKYSVLKEMVLNLKFFTISLFLFLLTVGHYSFNDVNFHSLGVNLLVKIIAANAAIFSIYYIVNFIEWPAVANRYITKWGMSSIVIYTTHFKFIEIFKGVYLIPEVNVFLLLLISSIVSIAIIEFCMLLHKIVKLSPLLNLILYGQTASTFFRNQKLEVRQD